MRPLRFLPLTFLCGVHGFVYFAPYLAVFLAVAHYVKRRKPQPVPATAATLSSMEFHPVTA